MALVRSFFGGCPRLGCPPDPYKTDEKINIFAFRASKGPTWFPRERQDASKMLQEDPNCLQEAPKSPQEADNKPPGGLRLLDFMLPLEK